MTPLSLRGRLTVWYGVVLVTVLAAFVAGFAWIQGRMGLRRVDVQIADVSATVVKIVGNELEEGLTPQAASGEALDAVADSRLAVAVLDDQRTPLATRPESMDVAALVAGVAADDVGTVTLASDTFRVRWRHEQILTSNVIVVVARSLADIEREQRAVWEAMLLGIPIVLALAAIGGWWLASIGLAPITDMANRASKLPLTGSDDLGDPVRQDELGQLTTAFNGLVARLRAALETQRQFMADASHELRTPVSIASSAADVALSRAHRSEDEYRQALAIVRDQARRLGRLMDDMLVLARADAGGYPVHRVDMDLGELADECQRAVSALAAERSVTLRLSGGSEVPVRGDEDLLRRLVLNLLQNAIRHTPPGGSVTISTEPATTGAVIRVADSGPGIPDADRLRIFDRFVRLDDARSGNGSGLGLPIAKWIAEAHGGDLTLEHSGPDGSTFRAVVQNA
jgi:heavy metal sensor kinase